MQHAMTIHCCQVLTHVQPWLPSSASQAQAPQKAYFTKPVLWLESPPATADTTGRHVCAVSAQADLLLPQNPESTKPSPVLQCAEDPVPIGVGYLAQYIVKPLLGYCIAKVPLQQI